MSLLPNTAKMLGEPDNIALANALTKALAIIERLGEQAQPPKRIDTVLEKAQQVVYEYEVAMPSWNKGDYKYLFAKALVDGQQGQPATVGEIAYLIEDETAPLMSPLSAYQSKKVAKAMMSAFDVRKK